MMELHSKLDAIFVHKAKGASIHSKAEWIEEGEQNTSYFCRLEKRHQERNAVRALLIGNEECSVPKMISNEIFSERDCLTFFELIKETVPTVNQDYKNTFVAEMTTEELDNALNLLHVDKSPGLDGFCQFLQTFLGYN